MAHAFDRVWKLGLHYKLSKLLPKQFAQLSKSYISKRAFREKQEDDYSELKKIKIGVRQDSILGSVLNLLYTSDIPELDHNAIAIIPDDIVIMAVGINHKEAAINL